MKKKFSVAVALFTGIVLSSCNDSKSEPNQDTDSKILHEKGVSDANVKASLNQIQPSDSISDSMDKIKTALNNAYSEQNVDNQQVQPVFQAQKNDITTPGRVATVGEQPVQNIVDLENDNPENAPGDIKYTSPAIRKQNVGQAENESNRAALGNMNIDTTVGILNNKTAQAPVIQSAPTQTPASMPQPSAVSPAGTEEKQKIVADETRTDFLKTDGSEGTAPVANIEINQEPGSSEEITTETSAAPEKEPEQITPPVVIEKKQQVRTASNNGDKVKQGLGIPASFLYKRHAEYSVTEESESKPAVAKQPADIVVTNKFENNIEQKETKNIVKKTNINQGPAKASNVLGAKNPAVFKSDISEKKPSFVTSKDSTQNPVTYNESTKPVEVVENNEAVAAIDTLPSPEAAKSGECYGKVTIQGETKEVEEEAVVTPETTEIVSKPAEYKEVEEEIVVKEASTKLVDLPATYKTVKEEIVITPEHVEKTVTSAKYKEVEEKILVSPAQKAWEKTQGTIDQGEVMKLVEKPAVYKTAKNKVLVEDEKVEEKTIPAVTKMVEKQVIDQPAHQEKIDVMPVTKKIKKQVLVKDATTEEVKVPAVTEKVTHLVNVTPNKTEWLPVICDESLNRDVVKKIQGALLSRGYKISKVDGALGPRSKKAIQDYQQSIGLTSPGIALKTLDSLAVQH